MTQTTPTPTGTRQRRFVLAYRVTVLATAMIFVLVACGGDNDSPAIGSHLQTDAVGDTREAADAFGNKPKDPLPAADILGVRMDGDAQTLRIRIAIGGAPLDRLPVDEKMGPAWFVQLWESPKKKGAPQYFVAVVRDGTPRKNGDRAEGWRLSICKGNDVCDEPAAGATLAIVDKEIRIEFPRTLVKKLGNPFSWAALSYWNDASDPLKAWSDWVPDEARPTGGPTSHPEPPSRVLFPPKKR